MRNPGADDRAGCDKAEVVIHPKLFEQHPHGRGFNVETADRLTFPQQPFYAFVILEPPDVVDVGHLALTPCLTDDVQRLADLTQAALTQDIEFVKSHVFGNDHVEMRSRVSLRGKIGGRIVMDGFFRDQDASRMNAQVIGEPFDELSVAQDQPGIMVKLRISAAGKLSFRQGIDFVRREAEHLAQFAHDRPVLEGGIGGQQGHVGEPAEDIPGNVFPVPPGEVDIEIRRILPVQIDEPLEIEVKLDGVDIGDPQHIGDYAVGAASAADIKIAFAPGIGSDVPVDQEIRYEALLPDNGKLLFHPLMNFRTGIGIAVL